MDGVGRITGALILMLGLVAGRIEAAESRAEIVAMITDVQGKVTLSAQGEARPLAILTEVRDDASIELAPAARLVAVWLSSGEEYSFAGPAAVRFTSSGPQMLSGATPARRPSALEKAKDIRIRATGVTQAAVVMRSLGKTSRIRLLTLAGTRTLEPSPEFRWQPIPGIKQYRFELADMTGRALLETEVGGGSFSLPASLKLEEGVRYSWEISARLPDGRKYAASADFSVAPAAERARVDAVRPSAGASLSERVAYAVWLDQIELRDEARKYWKDAANERPQDTRLRQLAGE